jgi:hypothetical protein
MAAIALANFGLVLFDLSYIPLRDFYLTQFPDFTRWYGQQFKGIEPNRTTEAYLNTIAELENQVAAQGLSSPSTQAVLDDLRQRSNTIIDEDPFEIANKSGTLERIKERMRDRIAATTGNDYESSKQAFAVFWSQEYLNQQGFRQEMAFWDERIRPLIATNYYRNIGFDGRPLNQFILIDVWFIGIFGIEFLARTWYLSRRYSGTSWLDTMLWRWYDFFLLIPFSLFAPSWALLRLIPVTIRVNQSNLIDMEPLRDRITRGIIANFAVELTEIVIIRVIEQLQNLIRQGDITRALLHPDRGPRYVDLNNIDEVSAISQRLSSTLIRQVLPQVRPDVEALLHHNVIHALEGSPIYQGVQRVPGLNKLPDQITQQLVSQLYQGLYDALNEAFKDEKGAELTRRLIENVGKSFRSEIQKGNAVPEIQSLITVWLDEVKINYVKRLAEEDVDLLREQTQHLYEITQGSNK